MSRHIYETYCNGDTIPDDELAKAIRDYKAAHDALLKLGPAFEVSRKEISRVWYAMEGWQAARKRK